MKNKSVLLLTLAGGLLISLYSCSTFRPIDANGQESSCSIKFRPNGSTAARLNAEIFDNAAKEKLYYGDFWINDARYQCDSSGKISVALRPGKYSLTARAMGFTNYTRNIRVKKGRTLHFKSYLKYYQAGHVNN